jgi:hypothetical protein
MGKSWENIQTFKIYPEKKGAFWWENYGRMWEIPELNEGL